MGASSPEKKRKRDSDRHGRPSKKAAIKPTVKVEYVENPDGQVPIITTTPGMNLPDTVPLNAYVKPRERRLKHSSNATISSSELLLHTSAHPRLDFTGKEGENELDKLWDHYVAVYDPEQGTVKILDARKMTVRGCMRHASPEIEEEEETDTEAPAQTAFSQRSALAEAFGTKQARKAVQSITENALLSNTPRGATTANAAESALLSTIPTDTTGPTDAKTAQQEIQASKPLPQPDLSATQPSDVYSIASLVPNGLSLLRQIPIKDWQEASAASEDIPTPSRFVSKHVESVIQAGQKTNMQILRFILILLELTRTLKRSRGGQGQGPDSRKLPAREELRSTLANAAGSGNDEDGSSVITDSFLDALRRKYVPQGSFLSRNDITFLHTSICALSLHIPPASGAGFAANELATDIADLRDDLRVDNQTITKYYRELGCKVDKPREGEFARWGVKRGKVEAAAMKIARLKIPLDFPKLSRGGMRR